MTQVRYGWDRAVLAYLAAAGVGSLTLGLETSLIVGSIGSSSSAPASTVVVTSLIVFVGVTLGGVIPFLLGLVLVASPAWWLLDRVGWTCRLSAVLGGAALTSLTGAAVVGFGLSAAWAAMALAAPGGCAGWTLHRVAYGR